MDIIIKIMNTLIKVMEQSEKMECSKHNVIRAMDNVNDINEMINNFTVKTNVISTEVITDYNIKSIIDVEPQNTNNYIGMRDETYTYNVKQHVPEYKKCMSTDKINDITRGEEIGHRTMFSKLLKNKLLGRQYKCKNEI